ncbi:hypothetical protein SASPL_145410 [Salvia splendens]|uniref:Plastocyanin-like domain-containing protein n=1 Tax=Salvia splendens TaxID=180675 RepID=A0A8X8WHN4_SALSN|nr:hypothetical protein SASPL_145410 [Salvia splendens]
MHLHGYSFYLVGMGTGNFNRKRDSVGYNLVDPPLQNTIVVPSNGWTAIMTGPDVSWGMEMAFIVKNGKTPDAKMLPPIPDMPKC